MLAVLTSPSSRRACRSINHAVAAMASEHESGCKRRRSACGRYEAMNITARYEVNERLSDARQWALWVAVQSTPEPTACPLRPLSTCPLRYTVGAERRLLTPPLLAHSARRCLAYRSHRGPLAYSVVERPIADTAVSPTHRADTTPRRHGVSSTLKRSASVQSAPAPLPHHTLTTQSQQCYLATRFRSSQRGLLSARPISAVSLCRLSPRC